MYGQYVWFLCQIIENADDVLRVVWTNYIPVKQFSSLWCIRFVNDRLHDIIVMTRTAYIGFLIYYVSQLNARKSITCCAVSKILLHVNNKLTKSFARKVSLLVLLALTNKTSSQLSRVRREITLEYVKPLVGIVFMGLVVVRTVCLDWRETESPWWPALRVR